MKNFPVKLPLWTESSGYGSNLVLTSRIRLARNLRDFPFPAKCSREERLMLKDKFREAIISNPFFENHRWVELTELSPIERQVLLEEHIISPKFSLEAATGRALTYNHAKTESIMINEEDHLRLQVIEAGLELKQSWLRANRLDDEIESRLDYAFSTEFGYKTACPTNMGSALRASLMLHLPGHALVGGMKKLVEYVSGVELLVRGIFGEGTEMIGNLVQISNQWSIGDSEEDVLEKLERIARYVIDQELNIRETIMFESQVQTEDKIHRDFALLKAARILPIDEFMSRFSMVRMGVDTGILSPIPQKTMNQLLFFVRPALLQTIYGIQESTEILDRLRADMVREALEGY